MSFAGTCKIHGTLNITQDVGHGKWVPVCPACDHERKAALAKAFWAVGTPVPDPLKQVEIPESLAAAVEALATMRGMALNEYVVEKLWAIVRMNQLAGPPED